MKNFSLETLKKEIFAKKSFLCVGLDVDLSKIPPFLLKEEDPIFAFKQGRLLMLLIPIPLLTSLILLFMKLMGKKVGNH